MMFAKSMDAKEAMQHNWNNMVLDRKYVAVVEGSVADDEGVIQSYLGETSQHEVYSSQRPEDGKLAVTRYRVLSRGNGYSLMEYSLDTGRKNQIRVHSRELGHPIAGDRRYGAKASPIARLALHARTLNFVHPITHRQMKFETPIPERFLKLVKGGFKPQSK
jgi:23S rRNA pseudouridine1911/1915/1917 synthase